MPDYRYVESLTTYIEYFGVVFIIWLFLNIFSIAATRLPDDWPERERVLVFLMGPLFPVFFMSLPFLLRIRDRFHPVTRSYLRVAATLFMIDIPLSAFVLYRLFEIYFQSPSAWGPFPVEVGDVYHPHIIPLWPLLLAVGLVHFAFIFNAMGSQLPFGVLRSKELEDGDTSRDWDRLNFLVAYTSWFIPVFGVLFAFLAWRSLRAEVRLHCIQSAATQAFVALISPRIAHYFTYEFVRGENVTTSSIYFSIALLISTMAWLNIMAIGFSKPPVLSPGFVNWVLRGIVLLIREATLGVVWEYFRLTGIFLGGKLVRILKDFAELVNDVRENGIRKQQ